MSTSQEVNILLVEDDEIDVSEAFSVTEVAKRLNVSPATLYRHLPGGKHAAMHD